MNPEQKHDEKLSAVLRQWAVDAPLPPRFREQVWQRIAQAETRGGAAAGPSFTAWLESVFSRPLPAVCYVAVLLLAGAATGLWQAKFKAAEAESQWRARYVQSVDPYRMHGN